jgi:hypothetical protein
MHARMQPRPAAVEVAEEEQALEKHHRPGPDIGASAETGKQKLGGRQFEAEGEEGADEGEGLEAQSLGQPG